MARIAVGGFQHETNTFAPQLATWADFERADAWPGFVRGAELIDAVAGYNIPIAGAVEARPARRDGRRALRRRRGRVAAPHPRATAFPGGAGSR